MAIKPENRQIVRKHLFSLLGKFCRNCGSKENLEFDHIVPNGYRVNSTSSWRVFEWLESYDKGNLQILCTDCNKRKSNKIVNPKKNYYYSRYCDRLTKCIDCRSSERCKKKREVQHI